MVLLDQTPLRLQRPRIIFALFNLVELNLIAQKHEGSVSFAPKVVEEATQEDLRALFEELGNG